MSNCKGVGSFLGYGESVVIVREVIEKNSENNSLYCIHVSSLNYMYISNFLFLFTFIHEQLIS